MRGRPVLAWAAVAALVGFHWLMAVSALRDKSTMFDEIAHLTAGESFWLTGDIRLQPEGGILPQRWQALGLVGGGFRFPSLDQPALWQSDAYAMGYHYFYESGNDVGAMLRRGRAAAALPRLPNKQPSSRRCGARLAWPPQPASSRRQRPAAGSCLGRDPPKALPSAVGRRQRQRRPSSRSSTSSSRRRLMRPPTSSSSPRSRRSRRRPRLRAQLAAAT